LLLWLLGEEGRRHRLKQAFPVTFYAAGPSERLRQLWRRLRRQPAPLKLGRDARRDLFLPEPVPVLRIEVAQPADQPGLFEQVSREFPDLTFYDADLPLALRHAAAYGTFPLAFLRVTVDDEQAIQAIETIDTPWELDPPPAPLRILSIEPDCDPRHAPPQFLRLHYQPAPGEAAVPQSYRLPLETDAPGARRLLANLAAILRRHDPDVLLTGWGDTWLLPLLLDLSEQHHMPLPLNRDPACEIIRKREFTYFSYGQVIHRGQQVLLAGRWHIDLYNAMLYHDYGLEGVLEMARVSAAPVQASARLSPGSGISAMQIVTALRQEVLVPWHKQQAEDLKSALDLIQADQGGLVYQPVPGLHRDVAEIDFISMYPGIMVRFNISPETVGPQRPTAVRVPALNLWIDRQEAGLIPLTLEPLLDKRIALKRALMEMPAWDPRRRVYKARASAHKWLLVTCFGYLGYKNARFGRIEAHESVTAYGREALLRAKETAEEMGYEVLHMYVDGLWVRRLDPAEPATVRGMEPLLEEISRRTNLPISLEGIYRWVAFLSSRVDERVPVANRYFGVFQDGSLKMRGIEARRRDTPPFIVDAQLAILDLMARATDAGQLPACLPQVLWLLRRTLQDLYRGRIPAEALLVSQKLSRELDKYSSPSPAARAATQLAQAGKPRGPGQLVRFIHMRGWPGVHAWDLPEPPDLRSVDVKRYRTLLLRAVATITYQPFGVSEEILAQWLLANAGYGAPPGMLPPCRGVSLWAHAPKAPPSELRQAQTIISNCSV
jgi:DNA polymerase-2